jgi:hypothetical protein
MVRQAQERVQKWCGARVHAASRSDAHCTLTPAAFFNFLLVEDQQQEGR